MKEKFIAISTTRFIKTLRPTLDIEKSKDPEYIKRSGKSFIGWHPTANAGRPIWEYYRDHNLPSYFVERGAFPHTVVIDPDGFLCDSSSYDESNWNHQITCQQEKKLNLYFKSLKDSAVSLEHQKSLRMTEEYFRRVINVPDKEIIFVPLQLEGDTVIKMWSDWTVGVDQFYHHICRLAKQHKDKVFLVKPHPLSKIKVKSEDNLINVDKFHYKDCLAYCDKVITINSGLGCQAMAWQKPTIIAGRAWYHFDGINYKANNVQDISDLLQTNLMVDIPKSRRFLYFLKFELYSDCVQTKKKESRFINRTDEVKYIKVRIFKAQK